MSRPTHLSLLSDHCPQAVSFEESGAPYDRSIFQAGTAAHAIIQACGEQTNKLGRVLEYEEMQEVARAVCDRLISEGRSFEDEPEPPLNPDSAFAGRDIALAFLAPSPLFPGAYYERGYSVDENWKPCEYGKGAHFRSILDRVEITESEDGETLAIIDDWKSSWATTADRLQHVQHRAQAVLVSIYHPEVTVIRRQVTNLRSRVTYSEDMYLAYEETAEQLEEWQADEESTLRALEKMKQPDGSRPAIPGARCEGCRFLGQCESAQEWLETTSGSASKEDLARSYAVTVAEVGRLRDLLKAACGEEPVELEDATVGYQRVGTQVLKAGAYRELFDEWCGAEPTPSLEKIAGLLHALDLSKTSAEKALRVLYPDRKDAKDRRELLESWCEPSAKREFKVTRK